MGAGVGLMVEVGLLLEVEVGPTQDMEEELVQQLVVQPVVGVATKFVVGATTDTRSWVLSVLAATMHQPPINMSGRVRANMECKKLVSHGLVIAVASFSYPSPSSCCSRCFPCCTTCSSLVPSLRRFHQRQPRPCPRQRHARLNCRLPLAAVMGR